MKKTTLTKIVSFFLALVLSFAFVVIVYADPNSVDNSSDEESSQSLTIRTMPGDDLIVSYDEFGKLVYTEPSSNCYDILEYDSRLVIDQAIAFKQQQLNTRDYVFDEPPIPSYWNIPESYFENVSDEIISYPITVNQSGFRGRIFIKNSLFSSNQRVSSVLVVAYIDVPSACIYNGNTSRYEINLEIGVEVLYNDEFVYFYDSGEYEYFDFMPIIIYKNPTIGIGRNGSKSGIVAYKKTQNATAWQGSNTATHLKSVLVEILNYATNGLSGVLIELCDFINSNGTPYVIGNTTLYQYYLSAQLSAYGDVIGGFKQQLNGYLSNTGNNFSSQVFFNAPVSLVSGDTGWIISWSLDTMWR